MLFNKAGKDPAQPWKLHASVSIKQRTEAAGGRCPSHQHRGFPTPRVSQWQEGSFQSHGTHPDLGSAHTVSCSAKALKSLFALSALLLDFSSPAPTNPSALQGSSTLLFYTYCQLSSEENRVIYLFPATGGGLCVRDRARRRAALSKQAS